MHTRLMAVLASVCAIAAVSCVHVTKAQPLSKTPLRIAVYEDTGASAKSTPKLIKAVEASPSFRVERIKAKAIEDGGLGAYDVVVFPGGSGSAQGKALGDKGREQVRAFVRRGGGCVGVCAGAYLATNDYSWSFGILNAKVVDKQHWARGFGDVAITLSPVGRARLGRSEEHLTIYYYQGPLLAPGSDKQLPTYDAWAIFAGEIAKKGAPKGVMIGTTAIAAARFGKGRVVCFSPHPELTKGLEGMLHEGIIWASGK